MLDYMNEYRYDKIRIYVECDTDVLCELSEYDENQKSTNQ